MEKVAANTTSTTRSATTRARDLAHLPPFARRIRHEAVVWAVQHGHSLGFDALTVILASKEAADASITSWTEEDVWQLWWVDLMTWCRVRSLPVPTDLAVSFATFFRYLQEVSGFDPGSNHLEDLLAALDATGATPRHPSTQQPVG